MTPAKAMSAVTMTPEETAAVHENNILHPRPTCLAGGRARARAHPTLIPTPTPTHTQSG